MSALRALLMVPAALLVLAAPAAAQDRVEASVELGPRVVGVGEPVKLTLSVEGPGIVMPRLRPRFDRGGLEVLAGPDTRHDLTLKDGGGWGYTWTWWLVAREPGAAAVTDVYVLVGDRRIDLPARRIEVLSQSVGGAEPPRSRLEAMQELIDRTRDRLAGDEPDAVFLRAVASPARPFVGQRIVYTVYLYQRTPVRSMAAEERPSFQGLWARPVDLPGYAPEEVDWEGDRYQRSPILRKELYALAARDQRIEPLRVRVVVEVPEHNRPFFLPTRRAKALSLASNPVDLDVRPLPPRPPAIGSATFAGTVGALALGADLRPVEVSVGQSATLTVTVAGEGHLESLAAPRIEAGDGIEVLGPQAAPADDLAIAPLAVPGAGAGWDERSGRERSWQYLLVPRRAGSWRLPPVEVAYFDPDQERYRVARAGLPELLARPAPAVSRTVAGGAIAGSRPEDGAGGWLARRFPGWRSALPWVLGVPALAALVLLFVRRRSGSVAAPGSPLARERLDAALAEERPRRAAAAIEGAWREMLRETLGVPETVPPGRWADEALARGANRRACRALRALVDDLHYLRFAPELSETRSLTAELVERSESVARDLHVGGGR